MASCRDVVAPCNGQRIAYKLTIAEPRGMKATVIYNRHGDASLTTVQVPSTGPTHEIPLGTEPGIYDYRVLIAGYGDWIETNVNVQQSSCGPRTIGAWIFMYPTAPP